MSSPRCSIVINNYNYGRFLHRCVSSVLHQSVAAEVVVVDDGSNDCSREIIESFGDSIRAVFQENQGQAVAMNAGVDASNGEIVAFLDSDDWVFPSKVEQIIDAFNAAPAADWLRHNLTLADDDDLTNRTLYTLPRSTTPHADYVRFGDTAATTSCLAFRKPFLTDVIGNIPALFTTYADTYLKVSAALLGQHTDCPNSLGARRIHIGQVTHRAGGTPARVISRIRHRARCAERAAEIGELLGDRELAAADTWWQRRALVHAAIAAEPPRSCFAAWRRYAASLQHSDLAAARRLAFAAREAALALVPRPWFTAAWWITNDGRPVLRRANPAVR